MTLPYSDLVDSPNFNSKTVNVVAVYTMFVLNVALPKSAFIFHLDHTFLFHSLFFFFKATMNHLLCGLSLLVDERKAFSCLI